MKPKIFVTRQLPHPAMTQLERDFRVTVNPDDRVLTKGEVIEGAKKADALLSLLTDSIDEEVVQANPHLRVISNYAVGYNNVNVEAATEAKIPVCFTPGVLTDTTADLTFALILSVGRRIVESDQFLRAGKFHGWGPLLLLGSDIHHKTLGIIGMGRIGQAVAKRAAGFSMRILFTNDHPIPKSDLPPGCEQVEMAELLRNSDFVTVHTPMTPETHHLIGAEELRQMKESSYIINTARGPIIDEKALVEALRNKEIAGAGLDVFENEPAVEPELLQMEQCVLLPHVGSATFDTRTQMGLLAAENAAAIFNGREPHAIVNPQVLKREPVQS